MPVTFLEKPCLFEAGSKMKDYASTAPARANRGSHPPEKQWKTTEKRLAKQHTYTPDLTPKSEPKDTDKTCENPTSQSA